MPDTFDQARALLLWEAACERLRAALQPHADVPLEEAPSVAEALELLEQAVAGLREVFDAALDPQPTIGRNARASSARPSRSSV
jgi:hypothetical protein